ncbi:MAG: hypothetical protein AAGC60_26040 [Acidobacteriota bacterium]
MSRREADPAQRDGSEGGRASSGRRPWRRPRILERQEVEALAADCTIPGGKSDATCLFGFS